MTSVVTSTEEGIERLRAALDRYAGVVVAFSGGVDSGLLAVVVYSNCAFINMFSLFFKQYCFKVFYECINLKRS